MKTQAMMLAGIIITAGAAQAQSINGGIAVGGTGSYTSSSLTLNATQLVESSTGDLSTADSLSYATASTATVSGLSSTALTLTSPIADFFEFSTAGIPGSTGTTPGDRFDFELTSLSEVTSGLTSFYGSGILSDSTGALQSSPATFTMTFSGPNSESFSLDTVATPEPSSWVLAAIACGALGFFAYRRHQLGSI